MTRHHREMATCNGLDCGPECHFRALLATRPDEWGAYLDPRQPPVVSAAKQPRAACRHLGPATGDVIECPTCTGSVRLKTFACACHGACTMAKPVPGAVCCAECPDYSPAAAPVDASAIYVQVTRHSNGLGDHAVIVMACEALRRENPGRRVILHTDRPDCVPWVRLWWRDVTTAPLPQGARALQPLDDRPLGRRAKSRWQHAADRAGVSALAIPSLAGPLPQSAIEAVWRWQGFVVLVPEANSADRPWPLPAWMDLEARLIDRGIPTIVIGTNAAILTRFRSVPYVSQDPARNAALMRMAACVVGNDSGMAHLAGLLGTPTIALCGLVGGERVFGAYPTVRWIDGPLACNGCEWHDAERNLYNCQRCASLDMISVVQVVDAVEEAVCRRAWDYTLLPPGPRASLRRAVRETAHLDGDLAELGTRQGGGALLMQDAASGKLMHVFDTFTGMPCDDPDGGADHKGKHAAPESCVRNLFAEHHAALQVHAGIFPETTAGLESLRFACVHLDADHYAPTAAAISYFWPRLAVGGKIVFDDWRRGDCPGIERAVRERFTDAEIEDSAEYQCTVTKRS